MTVDTVIVVGACTFALAFVAAWLGVPELRRWLEAPKYVFQDSVRRYDRACHAQGWAKRETRRHD